MTTLSSLSPAYITANATAVAADIASGKTAYVNGGKVTGTGVYSPAMMQFDGSTGYYSKTGLTYSGNIYTAVFSFNRATFSGNTFERITWVDASGGARFVATIFSSNHASFPNRLGKLQIDVQNNVGGAICKLISTESVIDGSRKTVFFTFNATTGSASFIINGSDADDASNPDRVAPTTGTLATTPAAFYVGASNVPDGYFNGNIGFFGYRDIGGLTWQDFMYSNGRPKALDTIGWTEWNNGTFQTPMMTFDGSTGYYSKATPTYSGNKVTATMRFNGTTFTGGSTKYLYRVDGASGWIRASFIAFPSDHATPAYQSTFQWVVQNSAGTVICRIISNVSVLDSTNHTVFASYDGDAGTAVLRIDGLDADDTGHANRTLTTGTLSGSGAGAEAAFGASTSGALFWDGQLGFIGYREAYLTNWSDFMQADGTPKEIDEIGWSQWGGQPLFWNKGGLMTDNAGSAGAMTKNGTITGPSGGWPLFWNEAGDMVNNLGSAGAMTKNGTINVGKGGNYV